MFRHVVSDHIGDLLIKATKKDGSNHHGGLKAEFSEETGAFEGDVRGTDDESLSWFSLELKDVI